MALIQLPLRTETLLIRQFVREDAPAVLILSNEEAARAWLASQVYRDYGHALSTLELLISQYSTPGNPKLAPYVLAIEHAGDAALIGHVGFSPLRDEVEIGFAVARDYQRRGLATEAVFAASRWAFQAFALNRIVGITSAANTAARRTLQRAQFAYDGDETTRFQGSKREVSVYSLSGSWRPKKSERIHEG